MNYQKLKSDLEEVLDALQNPDTDIDEALKLHEKGQKLLKQLEAYLSDVETKISSKKP